MHEKLIPNHQAIYEVSAGVDAFYSEHQLTGEVHLFAAERIGAAEKKLDEIAETLSGETLDAVVAEGVNLALESNDATEQDQREAVELGVVEILQHPGDATLTSHELAEATAQQLRQPLEDVSSLKGLEAVKVVAEAIEAAENEPVAAPERMVDKNRADEIWNAVAQLSNETTIYTTESAYVTRLPVSLPEPGAERSIDAIKYATGEQLEQVLRDNGVSQADIESAKKSNWKVPLQGLPKELINTSFKADVYEAIFRSSDAAEKKNASERNALVSIEDIWEDSTLHHLTKSDQLDSILAYGHLAVKLDENGVRVTGNAHNGTINFGKKHTVVPKDATNKEHMDNLGYNRHGGGDVYIHYVRTPDSYRAGEEYHDDGIVALMAGGLPSTEISALMLRNENDLNAFENTWASVEKADFYIPIFGATGNLIYSREDFDEGRVPEVIQEKRAREEVDLLQQKWRLEAEKTELEKAAAGMGKTTEEYTAWKREQPIVRPML